MSAVVITGLGVVCPLGLTHEELATNFAAGLKAPASVELEARGALVDDIPLHLVPSDKRKHIGRLDRFCRMLLATSYLAVDSAGLATGDYEAERIGLSFGTGLGCLLSNEEYNRRVVAEGPRGASPRVFAYTVSSAAAGEVSIALGIKGPNVTSHMGFTAGVGALGYGFDLLEMGKADAVIVGGADVIGPALLDALEEMGLLKSAADTTPSSDQRAGIFPSEGAVVAVLERADRARERGARILASIEGYAAGFEPTLARSGGASDAMVATTRRALALSGRDQADIVVTSAHGTPLDDVERRAILEVFHGKAPPVVLAPKQALGESMGAAGLLGTALLIGLWNARPPLTDTLAFTTEGRELSAESLRRRLDEASTAVIHSVCYSGNIVNLVVARAAAATDSLA